MPSVVPYSNMAHFFPQGSSLCMEVPKVSDGSAIKDGKTLKQAPGIFADECKNGQFTMQ